MTIVHQCRYVKWQPEAINAMEMAPLGCRPLLAVVRQNGELEVWDASQNWMVRRAPSGGRVGRALECVAWLGPTSSQALNTLPLDFTINYPPLEATVLPEKVARRMPLGRLFTAGHDGYLVEWDIETMRPRRFLDVGEGNGGGIWCMTHGRDGRSLALGCGRGVIKVVDVGEAENQPWRVVRSIRLAVSEETRLLSLSWSTEAEADWLAVGTSESVIIVVDLNSKAVHQPVLHRIELDTLHGKPTLVWAVRFAAGLTIVSGNSLGQVQFWDARMGTIMMTSKVHHHATDIFTLAVHSSGYRVFASASDGRTLDFYNYACGENDRPLWRPLERITTHRHDVRASTCAWVPSLRVNKNGIRSVGAREVFISGGAGTELAIYKFDALEQNRIRLISPVPFSHSPIISIARGARMIVANLGNSVNLWQLGTTNEDNQMVEEEDDEPSQSSRLPLQLATPGRFLLKLNVPWEEQVDVLTISEDGRYLAYSTRTTLRLYRVKPIFTCNNDEKLEDVELAKLKLSELNSVEKAQVTALSFSSDMRLLAIAIPGKIYILNLPCEGEEESSLGRKVIFGDSEKRIVPIKLVWANDLLLTVDCQSQLYIIDDKRIVANVDLSDHGAVTAVCFLANTKQALLVTAEKHFLLVDLPKGRLRVLGTNLPSTWQTDLENIHHIAIKPSSGTDCQLRFCSQNYIVETNLTTLLEQFITTNPIQIVDASGPAISVKDLYQPPAIPRDTAILKKRKKDRRNFSRYKSNQAVLEKRVQPEAHYNFGPYLRAHADWGRILIFEYINEDEAVLVERPWEDILEALPAPQDRQEYGGF